MNWLGGFFDTVAGILPQPRFSEDREHFSPAYKNPCVSTELEKRVSIRLRMVAASNGQEAIEWVPESHYTRDMDTTRVNVFRDVSAILAAESLQRPKGALATDRPYAHGADRFVITSIAPVWATNEVIDPQFGGFRISIERLFCGVPPHPAYTHVLETYGIHNAAVADTEQSLDDNDEPHPDDTGVVQFFVAPMQRGGFANMYRHVYTTRAKLHEIAQFAGRESVLLSPASRSTLRDAMHHAPGIDPEDDTTGHAHAETDIGKDNDNNANERDTLLALPQQATHVKDSDFEIIAMDHPLMRIINEFGAPEHEPGHPSNDVWPTRARMIYRGDITPLDVSGETTDVRKQLGTMPTMYRVRVSCLQRVRRWLVASKYSKIRYTRLHKTGLRIITTREQSRALYHMYKDTLLDRPEQAPCITVILLVTYMTIQDNDRVSRIVAKTELK